MTPEPPSGFLTRPEASRLYNRSQRALERDLDHALLKGDDAVLTHFKLATKDGQTRDAHEVTIDVVKQLMADGMTPVWYVRESWLAEEFGRKGSPKPKKEREVPAVAEESRSAPAGSDHDSKVAGSVSPEIVTTLKQQLAKQDREIDYLRQELKIKNEQIKEANERTRESNVLMRELQKLLGNWQEQAFRSLPSPARSSGEAPPAHTAVPVPNKTEPNPNVRPQPSLSQKRAAPKRQSKKGTETRKSRQRKPAAHQAPQQDATDHEAPTDRKKPKWYEMPTIKRIFSR